MSYSIKKHIHLYSAWAASRAANVKNYRFRVEIGQQILNHSRVRNLILNPDALPDSANEFDEAHKNWRIEIITLATNLEKSFSHGVAAKLINVYLKSIIICGGYFNHKKAAYIHPPIDSVLLKELSKQNFNGKYKFWKDTNKLAWSNFSSDDYQNVIDEIRSGLKGRPLWEIEKFWCGYQ